MRTCWRVGASRPIRRVAFVIENKRQLALASKNEVVHRVP